MAAASYLHFREDWRELKRGRPGHRFQDRYQRAQRAESRGGVGKRIITMALAAIFIAVGIFFAVFPGPAVPFFFVGGALLATHSRAIARAMDWLEVRSRAVFAWLKK